MYFTSCDDLSTFRETIPHETDIGDALLMRRRKVHSKTKQYSINGICL